MRPTFTLILFLASVSIQANDNTDPDSLLANRQYFELRDELNSRKYKSLPVHRKLYYDAFLHNFFHDLPASNNDITQLISRYKKEFTTKQLADLLTKKIDNHVKLYEYKQAHATSLLLVQEYSAAFTPEEIRDLQN